MDQKIINNIKTLGIDMIDNAESGHPGIVLGAAPIIYTIYKKFLRFNPKNPNWLNRDRFVLSAGHGSALLYSTLYMFGYDITLDDLKQFRKLNSKTPGHPEYGKTPGVEVTTGPLGQGIATSVGLAMAEKKLNVQNPHINYKIYTLCGDGDLMEGVSYEACSLAGTLKLDNLIVLYDSNKVSLDGLVSKTFTEDILKRFEAMGWYVDKVKNGLNINDIEKCIKNAFKKQNKKPIFIEICTTIGKDSINEGTSLIHGTPLQKDDIIRIKKKLGIPNEEFYVNYELRESLINEMNNKIKKEYDSWYEKYQTYEKNKNLLYKIETKKIDLLSTNYNFDIKEKEATRETNNKIMKYISIIRPDFIGGSADLGTSTKTYLTTVQDYSFNNYFGSNIWFGVREHAMGAILNGFALTGFTPYGSTFLAFSDYLKPSIRLSCLMNLNVTYIFTHDSVNIGSDGPTHQPVEQLSNLRSIPNLNVYRPADFKELLGSWNVILNSNKPSALILSRMESKQLNNTNSNEIINGAYIVRRESNNLFAIILATGTEVETAISIANDLYSEYKVDIRVVSMPCMELFENNKDEYKKKILPDGYRTIVIEPSSKFGLEKYVYNDKYLITIDRFGVSGSSEEVLKELQFDYQNIKSKIINLLK